MKMLIAALAIASMAGLTGWQRKGLIPVFRQPAPGQGRSKP